MKAETTCGCCRKYLQRSLKESRGQLHRDSSSEVFTRTLVAGAFLASCSPACAAVLRARMRGRA